MLSFLDSKPFVILSKIPADEAYILLTMFTLGYHQSAVLVAIALICIERFTPKG